MHRGVADSSLRCVCWWVNMQHETSTVFRHVPTIASLRSKVPLIITYCYVKLSSALSYIVDLHQFMFMHSESLCLDTRIHFYWIIYHFPHCKVIKTMKLHKRSYGNYIVMINSWTNKTFLYISFTLSTLCLDYSSAHSGQLHGVLFEVLMELPIYAGWLLALV